MTNRSLTRERAENLQKKIFYFIQLKINAFAKRGETEKSGKKRGGANGKILFNDSIKKYRGCKEKKFFFLNYYAISLPNNSK